jgi:hypothetical protein
MDYKNIVEVPFKTLRDTVVIPEWFKPDLVSFGN